MAAETVIQLRRGSATAWASLDPVLSAGEFGLETDTFKMKMGNGSSPWTSLDYVVKQVDNLLLDNNTISSVNENGNIVLDPNGEGVVDVSSARITNVGTPSGANDAANKAYVDATKQGLDVKNSVRAATTANITLSGAQEIDGVNVVADDRVLVKNQDAASENGIYLVKSGSWVRSEDADSSVEVTPGMFTFVEQGTVNADSGWVLTTDGAITLGTTGLAFTQFSGAGSIVAGSGLTKNGNQLDVGGTDNRITVGADSIDIASTYVGQTSITTLGTVGTGTWQGSTVAVSYGGTGATTLTGYVKGSGTGALTASSTIPGTDVSGNILGNAANVTGVVAVANGGTGGTTVTTAREGLLLEGGSANYAGATSITTLGTVGTGTWQGSTVAVSYGGTGATTLTGYVKGSGTGALTASSTIPGTDVSGNILGNAANVTGVVAVANGGTGGTTVTTAREGLLLEGGSANYAGATSITTLGTVGTGTWQGSTVAVSYGGTGATTLTGYVKGNGTSALSASSTIPGTDVSGNILGNAANVTGVVAIANGGTGGTTVTTAREGLLLEGGSANYAGATSITTLGTIGTGTWQGSAVGAVYGGTGMTSYASGDIIYASASNTLSKLAKGSGKYFLKMDSAGNFPEWSNSLDGGTP